MNDLKTKEIRLKSRDAHIEWLKEHHADFQQEQYNDLEICTYSQVNYAGKTLFCLEIYRGTAYRPTINSCYGTLDGRNNGIKNAKESSDRNKKYKDEQKQNGKHLTTAATVSARIKKELKAKYPGVKFEVKSSNFAGGNSVDIRYIDSVPYSEIDKYCSKYSGGHFNGMEDIYENAEDVLEVDENGKLSEMPTAKFIMVSREVSPAIKEVAKEWIRKTHEMNEDRERWIDNSAYRLMREMNLSNGFDVEYAKNYPYGLFDR